MKIKEKAPAYAEAFRVRMKGVEPPRLAALDPKSSVSTNSTTSAIRSANILFFVLVSIFEKISLLKSVKGQKIDSKFYFCVSTQ